MDNKITTFIERLRNIGINIELGSNVPWIYIEKINGQKVTERYMAKHGFTLAFLPIRPEQKLNFTSIPEIFKLLRKYCKNEKKS